MVREVREVRVVLRVLAVLAVLGGAALAQTKKQNSTNSAWGVYDSRGKFIGAELGRTGQWTPRMRPYDFHAVSE